MGLTGRTTSTMLASAVLAVSIVVAFVVSWRPLSNNGATLTRTPICRVANPRGAPAEAGHSPGLHTGTRPKKQLKGSSR